MTDSRKEELREKLKSLAGAGQEAGLAARFYSEDVLVLCLPEDEEKSPETERQGTAPPSRPRGEGGKGRGESALL